MAHSLKAGLMATTTMVGSAVAYNKTMADQEERKSKNPKKQNNCLAATQTSNFGGNQNQKDGTSVAQCKDTFDQI